MINKVNNISNNQSNPLVKKLSVYYRKIIFIFLITSLLLSFNVKPLDGLVSAQTNGHTVYLPLVSKNYQEWLDLFNQYRSAAGLNPVASNDSMNYGLSLHTKYMLLNPDQSNWHTEIYGKPGYTPEGELAASESNMLWSNSPSYTVKQSIDLWMATEKHRYHMLNPDLMTSGFSLACDGINCFAGLNVLGGLKLINDVRAVFYPGIDQTNVPPTKYPISVGFYPSGQISSINVTKFSLFDSNNIEVSTSQTIINEYVKEVVIKPNNNLMSNHKYRVEISVSAGGKTFNKTWYFTTGQ